LWIINDFFIHVIQADMMFSQSTNPGVAATELAEKMTQRNLVTLHHLALHPRAEQSIWKVKNISLINVR
jgi:hypothetical protein